MTTPIPIGERLVGYEHPTLVIAEACDNHLGSLERAREMVRAAKLCEADAIKFQHHLPDEEMLREGVPQSDNFDIPLYEFLLRYSLSLEDHAALMEYCAEVGIMYLCTPFSTRAALELDELGVEAFKIGSGELTDLPSLKVIAGLGKPMIISTGMATWEEIEETVKVLKPLNAQLILLNCTSEYPARHEDINLGVIALMKDRFGLVVGHSDHTPDIASSIAAVALGAKVIEKHFILDRGQPGPDQSVSIEPYQFHELVQMIRRVEKASGARKAIHPSEKPIREWAHRSIVTLTSIKADTMITQEMVWTKRPGTGIPARHLESVIGRRVKGTLPSNHLLQWDDLQ